MPTASASTASQHHTAEHTPPPAPGAEHQKRVVDGVLTALISVAVVALLRWLLHPVLQEGVPYTMFLASVAMSTQRAGWRCGAAVMGLSIVVATYLFVRPWSQLALNFHAAQIVTLCVFVASSCLVIWIISREAAAQRRMQEREWLLRSSYAERMALERQLEEARKLECLGKLAGGVAHDFNNLTTVIMGSADLLKLKVPDEPLLDSILLAATRSSEITKQLLGLGRRQMMVLQTVAIDGVVQETVSLCERLLPEHIAVRVTLPEEPWAVRGDTSVLQQILLNLLTNARDAMPDGGVIELRVENMHIDATCGLHHPELGGGQYVRLSVQDSGLGMDVETQRHAFEPFFTAKPSGTGLGLAVVYGLVMQLGGAIHLESQVGEGTRVDVYLPRVEGSAAESTASNPRASAGAPLSVLLAEDHPLVRGVVERMLRGLGHAATVAEDGEKALSLADEAPRPDVLITDIGMPGVDGYRLAELMRARFPRLAVVLISGYDTSDKLQQARSELGFMFLRKPFTAAELDDAITQARTQAEARRPRLAHSFAVYA
jgi:signal transduction histidine kinase/ActR/RegA family two-component response regulator